MRLLIGQIAAANMMIIPLLYMVPASLFLLISFVSDTTDDEETTRIRIKSIDASSIRATGDNDKNGEKQGNCPHRKSQVDPPIHAFAWANSQAESFFAANHRDPPCTTEWQFLTVTNYTDILLNRKAEISNHYFLRVVRCWWCHFTGDFWFAHLIRCCFIEINWVKYY
ncbi:hypothetical protein Tsp_10447 [Trichinella spiralis]|uniref:hypothetical protein n=1 Tax=Trichinella spiralis TaxID=6334 RepID=UPI0001EFEE68|nr:hypothetical protein Tsp_10447 [Trichinella spiralis]